MAVRRLAVGVALALCACTSAPVSTYKAGVLPGIGEQRLAEVAGRPTSASPFSLAGLSARVLTYPFGQVVVQGGKVIVVTIQGDQAYVGPLGAKIGMSEDQLKAAFAATPSRRTGHVESYDLIANNMVTRMRDLYDETDGVMFELAAANPNDPLAPYSIININLADAQGRAFLLALTKAKVAGSNPDQRIDNEVTEPWST
jgi:hypothetical protein